MQSEASEPTSDFPRLSKQMMPAAEPPPAA